ncbi:helix-turn-helix domain-containing protein [Gracilimonas mengyeensis]|uniref:DNA binding domain-containing protein, excisionase family n=1 Tax=Gracilimonas mengyeensis TaxID=1302730 RepID=A0A521CP27_9BACT|nr:helix-turn-helix domain-containing protein [Gracilimonas mengyeensis]SMO61135.1 DNA binding domain-containing protein, excisionase family [Gracilimonas mengyeensis]
MPKKIGDLTLYTVDDLHDILGISKMTLRTYLREGRLRGRKLGVSWYVTEEAIREYFDEPTEETSSPKKKKSKEDYRYIVQGINDLVSETEECETISEVIETLNEQAIISLFQVRIVDRETNEITEIVKARDFLERHA